MTRTGATRAVVLGGGLAGVLAARVLAGHVDEVVLVEAGRYPARPVPRPGLPQAHHSHVLVSGGAQALETLLPGTLAALYAHGAHRRGLPGDALIRTAEGWFRRMETDAYLVSCSRWLLDHVVRQRALGDPGDPRALGGLGHPGGLGGPGVPGGRGPVAGRRGVVRVCEGTRAAHLLGDASRVTGVVLRRPGQPPETLSADLVVDATGRASAAPRRLADLGVPAVVEETVDPGLAYATRVYQAPADLAASIPAVMIHPAAVRPARGATLFPIEAGRWIVTLTGTRGGEPPADPAGYLAFARSLASPLVADLLAAAEPLTGVRAFHGTTNRRRFFERAPLPDGFLVLGDGLVAVNPVHSHGMSIVALCALRLDAELADRGADPSATPKLQAAMAEVADRSWQMAIAQDRQQIEPAPGPPDARPQDPRPRDSTMVRRMLGSRPLAAEFFRAQTLMPAPKTPEPALLRALAQTPEPLLTTAEALAQFPVVSGLRSAP